jgi:hypothetical protein
VDVEPPGLGGSPNAPALLNVALTKEELPPEGVNPSPGAAVGATAAAETVQELDDALR